MGDELDGDDAEELFNDDFDDHDTTLRAGVRTKACSKCGGRRIDYRVEGRFVIRTCRDCGHEMED